MMRLVPPAGAPLPLRTLAHAMRREADPPRGLLGMPHTFWLSSGRAALVLLLRAMQARSPRREVVIPAYTCFSLASAIARAGLSIRLCDVDPKTLDLDPTALVRLDLHRVLCIVPSSLYGLPSDLEGLQAIARSAGAFLVDDAAQSLGGTVGGRPCGTFGDAGLVSLGRGKVVTTMGGGALVTRSSVLAAGVEEELRAVAGATAGQVAAAVASAVLYRMLLPPSRYWLVDRLPFVELGGSRFDPDFPMARLSEYQRRLAARLMPCVDRYNASRRRCAAQLRAGIDGVEGIEIPRPVRGASPVYSRFPLLARDAEHRASLLGRLRAGGIVASASYPTAIGDIPDLGSCLASGQAHCPGAASVAERILTLPTHPGVSPQDIVRMVAIVRGERASS